MGRGVKTDVSTIKNIIKLLDLGAMTKTEIGEITGTSQGSVSAIHQATNAIREKNTEEILRLYNNPSYAGIFKGTAEALGVDVSTLIKKPEPPRNDNDALMLEKICGFMDSAIAAMKEIEEKISIAVLAIQGMRSEQSDLLKKVSDTININGDIHSKEHDRIAVAVESIKGNTKQIARKGGGVVE